MIQKKSTCGRNINFKNSACVFSLIPDVAGIRSCEAINIQTDVSHSQIEHKEVTGSPHLLHCEERQDADGVQEESEHA